MGPFTIQKSEKHKDILKLLLTNNIYMKQT